MNGINNSKFPRNHESLGFEKNTIFFRVLFITLEGERSPIFLIICSLFTPEPIALILYARFNILILNIRL